MNWFDLVLLLMLTLVARRGYRLGLVRLTAGMVAVGTGIVAAVRLTPQVQPQLERLIPHPTLAKWLSVIFLAALTTLAVDWLIQHLRPLLEGGALGVLNQLAGMIFHLLFMGGLVGLVLLGVQEYGGGSAHAFLDRSAVASALIAFTRHLLGIAQPYLPRLLPPPESFAEAGHRIRQILA